MAGVRGGAAAPGEYRTVQDFIIDSATGDVIYVPPPGDDVPELMRDLVQWMNHPHDAHPVIAGAIAQFQLVHIHPFLDGNGRTSRPLSMLCLYRASSDFKRLCAISEYYDRDRTAFSDAIQSVRQTQMDMTRWIEFFTPGLATQLAEVKQLGEVACGRMCWPAAQPELTPLLAPQLAPPADAPNALPWLAYRRRALGPLPGSSGRSSCRSNSLAMVEVSSRDQLGWCRPHRRSGSRSALVGENDTASRP